MKTSLGDFLKNNTIVQNLNTKLEMNHALTEMLESQASLQKNNFN